MDFGTITHEFTTGRGLSASCLSFYTRPPRMGTNDRLDSSTPRSSSTGYFAGIWRTSWALECHFIRDKRQWLFVTKWHQYFSRRRCELTRFSGIVRGLNKCVGAKTSAFNRFYIYLWIRYCGVMEHLKFGKWIRICTDIGYWQWEIQTKFCLCI